MSSARGGTPARPVIVGVGASAREAGALRAVAGAVPAGLGLAIVVVVPAGDADPAELMAALAGAAYALAGAEDGAELAPDQLYLVPPNHLAEVAAGRLRLRPAGPNGAAFAPIDHFLESLAADQRGRAVGVILAGPGSDGAAGLRAVGDAGGLALVQDPATARLVGMPSAARDSAMADLLGGPADLAAELEAYARHMADSPDEASLGQAVALALPQICDRLLEVTGHNFRHYKPTTLVRRINRRVQVLHLDGVAEYLAKLKSDPAEAEQLFRELLINVTAFFRDPDAFAALSTQVVARLVADHTSSGPIRVWVAGCATGEEAYTVAMLFAEEREKQQKSVEVQIFATDLDEQALGIARAGVYPVGAADEVPAQHLRKYFVKKGQQYHVVKSIRETVLFSLHNLINDPPFSRLHLVLCRNVLIYLGPHLQKKLVPLFHFALDPGGYLFLGPSESLNSHRELFRPVDVRHRISQRLATAIRPAGFLPGRGESGAARSPVLPGGAGEADTYLVMQRITLDEFAPKAVVVNEEGQIVCASGNLEKYVGLGAGAFQNSLTRLAHQGLRAGVRAALAEAREVRRRVTRDDLTLHTPEGPQRVMVVVQPMPQMGDDSGLFYVAFQDVGLPARAEPGAGDPSASTAVEQLERELAATRDELERAVQDLETANQELKSGNEELLSMNEELQSANEELETSKEEVQLANEALVRANADLENLLASAQIATIFLDAAGTIRRVTEPARAVYRVRPSDAGRPLSDFTHSALVMPPVPTVEEVLASGAVEHEIELVGGGHYLRRALAYRDGAGAAEGVVLTFTDLTERKRAELELAETRSRLEAAVEAGQIAAWTWDTATDLVVGDRLLAEMFGVDPAAALAGLPLERYLPAIHPDDVGRVSAELRRAASKGQLGDLEFRVAAPGGPLRWVVSRGRRGGAAAGGRFDGVLADITERKLAALELERVAGRLKLAAEAAGVGYWAWDFATDRVEHDPVCAMLFGVEPDTTGAEVLGKIHPDDRPRVDAAIERARRDNEQYKVEFRVRLNDGSARWLLGLGDVLHDAAGVELSMTGVNLDITHLKAAEEGVRQQARLTRRITEAVSTGILMLDEAGAVAFANPAALAITGHGAGGLAGRPLASLLAGDGDALLRAISAKEPLAGHAAEFATALGGAVPVVCNLQFVTRDGPTTQSVLEFRDTTKEREAAASLSASERRYRSLVSSGYAVVWLTTPAGLVEGELESWGRYTGQTPAEYAGLGWLDASHPDDCEGVRSVWGACVASRAVYEVEYRVRRRDGAYCLMHMRGVPVLGERGEVREWVGAGIDVTLARRAEQILRESEAWFRAMADAAPTTLWVTDAAGRCTFLSRRWYELTGQAEGEGLGDSWTGAIHPGDRAAAGAAFWAADRAQAPYQTDYRLRRADGQYRWALDVGTPRFAVDGAYLGMVGSVVDIHERKVAEDSLSARERELQSLADNSPDVLVRYDRTHSPVFVNRAVGTLTGTPPARFRGFFDPDLKLGPAARAAWDEALETAFAAGQHRSFEFDLDTPGGVKHLSARVVPETDPAGAVPFALAVVQDSTARKVAEAALREADRRKDEFLATLAHELRNPLAPVRTGLQVLRLTADSAAAARTRDMMERQLAHMVRLIDDLLDVSRITRGKLELRPEPVTLQAVVETALEASRPAVLARGHELTVEVPPEPVWLSADLTRLGQVVSNLLNNAAKYTPEGGRIELRATAGAGAATVVVRDDGFGIPPEMLDSVFEMFTQVNRTLDSSQGGLGIGLTLVRRLVELHGGTVTAESAGPGQGSTFTVTLPRLAAPPAPAAPPPSPPVARGLRVLVVDDNLDGAESLAMLLSLSGHDVGTAADGPSALRIAREFAPQVVLLDIGLPGMSGYEVARRLRADPPRVRPAIVALTGWGSDDDKAQAVAAGIDHHLTKPVDPAAVAELLGRLA